MDRKGIGGQQAGKCHKEAKYAIGSLVVITVLLLGLCPVRASEFYVSPTGSEAGDGSLGNPWDLQTALSQPAAVEPGDTIWLRGGIYTPSHPYCLGFQSWLTGASNAPIIVRQYPGERALLQRPVDYTNTVCTSQAPPNILYIVGNHTWFWGFEIRCTNTIRVINVAGSTPTFSELPLFNSVGVAASGIKLINLIVHDTRGGLGLFAVAVNSEVHGCIIYNNGWAAPDRGHGHGLYPQNLNGLMHLSDNIIFNQFGLGIHGYTEGSTLKHFLVEKNVVFNNGRIAQYPDIDTGEQILFGSSTTPVQDLNVLNNCIYLPLHLNSKILRLDYAATSNDNVVVANNYVAGGTGTGTDSYGASVQKYQSVIFTNNTLYATNGFVLRLQSKPGYVVDSNTYYGNSSQNFNNNGTQYNFAGWKSATGFDSNSVYLQNTTPPNKVVVHPNAYEPKRANIIVCNWNDSDNVSVDVSSVLSTGDVFVVRNAQDYFAAPVLTGTYHGGSLSLPMTNLSVAAPNGWTNAAAIPTTGKQFNVFVLSGATPPRITATSSQPDGSFKLKFAGSASNQFHAVEASTDLVSWASVGLPTNAPAGSGLYEYIDAGAHAMSNRFYRVRTSY